MTDNQNVSGTNAVSRRKLLAGAAFLPHRPPWQAWLKRSPRQRRTERCRELPAVQELHW